MGSDPIYFSCRKRRRLPGHHLPALRSLDPDVGVGAIERLRLAVGQELDADLPRDESAIAEDLNVLLRPLDLAVLPLLRADAVEVGRLAVGATVGMRVDERVGEELVQRRGVCRAHRRIALVFQLANGVFIHGLNGDGPHFSHLRREVQLRKIGSVPIYPSAIEFSRMPTLSISISTLSPGFIHTGGLRRAPTPPGVPVTSTSPGASVVHAETYSMIFGILKIICSVVACCMRSPFRRQD